MTNPFASDDPSQLVLDQQSSILQSSLAAAPLVGDAGTPNPTNDPDAPQIVDYWSGEPEAGRWYFPDKVQYIDFIALNHGLRSKYTSRTNQEMTMNRRTQDLKIKTDVAANTDVLLQLSITGWNVWRRDPKSKTMLPQPFDSKPGGSLDQWLKQASPVLVDDLEKAIREANPWLDGDITVASIDEEISRLSDLRAEKVKEEEKR